MAERDIGKRPARTGIDRVALWVTIITFLICILPIVLIFIVRMVESSLSCPVRFGEELPCMLGSTDLRPLLEGLEMPFHLLHEQNYMIVFLSLLAWAGVTIYRLFARSREAGQPERDPGNRRLLWAAIAMFVIGFGPVLANILSDIVASPLGCYVNEHAAYTRSALPSGYDSRGCALGSVEIGPLLHTLHMLIFAFLLTWPLGLVSLFLWFKLVSRWVDKRRA